uniref:DUF4939 domain-containing protein n=1 Tax=Maylandia zebra TaxID=106582 RepID=A0A3P9BK03_9CICH
VSGRLWLLLHNPWMEPAPAAASTPPAPLPPSDGPLPTPEPFTGESDKCAGFLAQCTLVFREQRRFHNNDGAKITFFVQLLRDRALKWAQVVLSSDPGIAYADFLSKFQTVFNKGSGAEADLRQQHCVTRRWIVELSASVAQ